MPILLPEICRAAMPVTKKLLLNLTASGVTHAEGRVIVSTGMGEPPVGYDRVSTKLQSGFPPLEESRLDRIRAAVAAEALAIVNDLSPGDCFHGRIVQASYAVDPVCGMGLVLEMYGLVDHEAHVFLT